MAAVEERQEHRHAGHSGRSVHPAADQVAQTPGSRTRPKYGQGVEKLENAQRIISLVLRAVALGMAVVSIVLGFLPEVADISTQVTLLSIGLFALALTALQKAE